MKYKLSLDITNTLMSHFDHLQQTEEPDAAALSEETKEQPSLMPYDQEDDLATSDAPACVNCVKSEAERFKYAAMAEELMQQLS